MCKYNNQIHINSEDRRGKTPDEAATLILGKLREIDEAEDKICFIIPSVWSWGHDIKVMRFCMMQLARKLVETVGDQFSFYFGSDETKQLYINATRITANS